MISQFVLPQKCHGSVAQFKTVNIFNHEFTNHLKNDEKKVFRLGWDFIPKGPYLQIYFKEYFVLGVWLMTDLHPWWHWDQNTESVWEVQTHPSQDWCNFDKSSGMICFSSSKKFNKKATVRLQKFHLNQKLTAIDWKTFCKLFSHSWQGWHKQLLPEKMNCILINTYICNKKSVPDKNNITSENSLLGAEELQFQNKLTDQTLLLSAKPADDIPWMQPPHWTHLALHGTQVAVSVF